MKRKDFFDSNAQTWDNDIYLKMTEKKIKNLIIPLLELKNDDKVIDIGSGTGILVPFIQEYLESGNKITELDFSEQMIKTAKKKYADTINCISSNAENIPVKCNSFSKAIIFNSFPHFEDKQKVICEIFRILKNNAIILLAHSDSKNVIDRRHKQIGGAVANDILPSTDKLKTMFEKAGFTNIESLDSNEFFYIKAIKQEESRDV